MAELQRSNIVGVLILAAGQSRRYGNDDKRVAKLNNGRRVIEQTIANCQAGGLPVRVVMRAEDDSLAKICLKQGASVIIAEDAEQGMGHSLAAGIADCENWTACLVTLADMPFVRPATYQLIAEALQQHDIVRPCYQGKPGQPNGFSQRYFEQLKQCSGDIGARHLFKTEPVFQLDVDDAGVLADIDTPEQLNVEV
jgi:molybdenum cofactor cytidylyltransferase